jgi:hypothetical protein
MKMRALILGIFSFLAIFTSCENEVDVNADWKDVPVVFGLLDPDSLTQYIRVSRVFLGEGDALQYAQIPDSLYYNPEDIEVKVTETLNGNVTRTWILDDTTGIAKDTNGIFAAPEQVVYYFKVNQSQKLNINAEYALTITNAKTGNVLKGQTLIVQKVSLQTPSNFAQQVNIIPRQNSFVKWTSSVNGKIYEVILNFIYREEIPGSSERIRKIVPINFGRTFSADNEGGEELVREIDPLSVYQVLVASIPASTPDNQRIRYADSLEYIINVGDEDLFTYLNVNQPSNTVAQERPQFNNVENGLGLFASRTTFNRKIILGQATTDSLKNNPLTIPLNFQ